MSDDGARGLTLIAFIGSVFSPYYAHARRSAGVDGADPHGHVALNVALYGADGRRWTMTERGAGRLRRDAGSLSIGPSVLQRQGQTLTIDIDEVTAPWPSRVRGRVTVTTDAWLGGSFKLDASGRHEWLPFAPCARIDVDLERPASRWSGTAYVDGNRGSVPLEKDFVRWHWSRGHAPSGRTTIFYDARRRDGSELNLALGFDPAGRAQTIRAPDVSPLPRSAWRIDRVTRSDAGSPADVTQTLEDGPFYARSVIRTAIDGEQVTAVHESLDLDRFASPWVQAMLPFRMPRRG